MFQCVEHQIECLDRLLSLGCVHPFEKAVEDGIVLERGFRAPPAHRMRIAPPVAAVARLTIESSSITRDSTPRQRLPGNEHRSSEPATGRPDVTLDALVER